MACGSKNAVRLRGSLGHRAGSRSARAAGNVVDVLFLVFGKVGRDKVKRNRPRRRHARTIQRQSLGIRESKDDTDGSVRSNLSGSDSDDQTGPDKGHLPSIGVEGLLIPGKRFVCTAAEN